MKVKRYSVTVMLVLASLLGMGAVAAQDGGISVNAPDVNVTAGDEAEVGIDLKNEGGSDIPVILKLTSVPGNWSIDEKDGDGGEWSSGKQGWLYKSIDSGSTKRVRFNVSVPETDSGTRNIDYSVKTPDRQKDGTVAINVRKASGQPGFTVVLAILAFVSVGAVAYFKRGGEK
ncbi:MAG: hypothetical protein ABEK59_09565 [Halobacteria archaeon]